MNLRIEYLSPKDLKPYENNTRKHTPEDIEGIKKSIADVGFADPIGIWGADNLIVEGHGRQIAAIEMGLDKVPVIRLDEMTDEQRREYAIRHNRSAEMSGWDFGKLEEELAQLAIDGVEMDDLQFDIDDEEGTDWFSREKRNDTSRQEGNEEYNEFLDKFEQKKTTDDCYTPENIYDAVAEWVAKEYGVERENFVRPFYPGGDYKKYKYRANSVVVDNPPFSILAEIIRFYCENGVRFFLFAPALTLFTAVGADVEYMPIGCGVLYENGATVKTSIINNMGDSRIYVSAELHEAVLKENDKNLKAAHKDLPKYNYPMECILSAQVQRLAHYGQTLKIPKTECVYKSCLDSQKGTGKEAYGGLFLISERAAAERESATCWALSEDEKRVIHELGSK